jgi:hypothetical protein
LYEQLSKTTITVSKETTLNVKCILTLFGEVEMAIILFEALLAVLIVGFVVWWTMRGK